MKCFQYNFASCYLKKKKKKKKKKCRGFQQKNHTDEKYFLIKNILFLLIFGGIKAILKYDFM